jgi:hypothetical protein
MAEVLQELVAAGLIDKLDGDDSRFEKMNRASSKLATDFRKSRHLLVPAILAGLDTAVSATDPLILNANNALIAEWPTVTSVYVDTPIMLLRGLLLDACFQAGEGVNAAILWLVAANTLPYSQLGREESTVHKMLLSFAGAMENEATALFRDVPTKSSVAVATAKPSKALEPEASFAFQKSEFSAAIGAALGPHGISGVPLGPNPTPHWPNSNQHWVDEASKRLALAIGDQIESLAEGISRQKDIVDQRMKLHLKMIQTSQQEAAEVHSRAGLAEKIRVDILWWFETLYSQSLRKSYRELDPKLSAIVMAMDLLLFCPAIAPASVAHILAEAVDRLRGASYDSPMDLVEILNSLKYLGKELPASWITDNFKVSVKSRLCIRDMAMLALSDPSSDTTDLLRRAALPVDSKISLPEFSKAVFRQEQALRLTVNLKAKT